MNLKWIFFILLVILYIDRNCAQRNTKLETYYETEKVKYKCRLFGWWRCTRYRKVARTRRVCLDGWTTKRRESVHREGCNVAICYGMPGNCLNGGKCVKPNDCQCEPGYVKLRCEACPSLLNCALTTCTYPDKYGSRECQECEGVHGESTAFELSSDKKVCRPKCNWRNDGNLCYPGTCPNLESSCQCAEGFGGNQCTSLLNPVSLLKGEINLRNPYIQSNDFVEIDIKDFDGQNVYTNIDLGKRNDYKISWDIEAIFQPHIPLIDGNDPRHHFIIDTKIGVIDGTLSLSFKQDGKEVVLFKDNVKSADKFKPAPKPSWKNVLTKRVETNDRVKSGSSFEIRANLINGGIVWYTDLDFGQEKPKFLNGQSKTYSTSLVFDYIPPVHQSVIQNTNGIKEILDIEEPITKSSVMNISWSNWLDELSGVSEYDLEIVNLIQKGDYLDEDTSKLRIIKKIPKDEFPSYQDKFRVTLDVPEGVSHVYQVILTVKDSVFDTIKNSVAARRIVIVDPLSSITKKPGKPIQVDRSHENSRGIWLRDYQIDITVMFRDHFINERQDVNGFLKPVKRDVDKIPSEYDSFIGIRNTNSVPNVQGCTGFRVQSAVNFNNYSTVGWTEIKDVYQQSWTYNQPRQDGDILYFWIEARDIMGNTLVDHVTFYQDASPPTIERLGLTLHNRRELVVHKYKELYKLKIEWFAFDEHSGIKSVHWKLFDNFTNTDIILGQNNLPRQSSCNSDKDEDCYCIPMGDCFNKFFSFTPNSGSDLENNSREHDNDLYLEISIENQAELTSVMEIKITIDESPPLPGHVTEGMPGEPDVDFQSARLIHANWEGFIDKESGIALYRYKFGPQCYHKEDLYIDKMDVNETTEQITSFLAPGPGKYFITVVAFNPGFDSSAAVCSDGITIDETPPLLSDFYVHELYLRGGIVRLPSTAQEVESFWYIKSDGLRRRIHNATNLCRTNSRTYSDLFLFKEETYPFNPNQYVPEKSSICSKVTHFNLNIFLRIKNYIELEWKGSDKESGIAEFLISLRPEKNSEESLGPEYSTSHEHLKFSDPDIQDGSRFYINAVARNRAGLITERNFGPILVHTMKPQFDGELRTYFENIYLIKKASICVSWQKGSFYDEIDTTGLEFFLGIGRQQDDADVIEFTSVQPKLCSPDEQCVCVSFREKLLNHQSYHATVKVLNSANFHLLVSTEFLYFISPPTKGLVTDLAPEDEVDPDDYWNLVDVDIQLRSDIYSAIWMKFQQVTCYYVCIGTEPGLDDLLPLTSVNMTNRYTATNLNMEVNTKYFFTVVAENSNGRVNVSSDGILILSNDAKINERVLFDKLTGIEDEQHYNIDLNGYGDCINKLTFTSSTSTVNVFWRLPTNIKDLFTEIHWALQELRQGKPIEAFEDLNFRNFGSVDSIIVKNVGLRSGRHYRSVVRFCHKYICFQPVVSCGFLVLADPPVGSFIEIQSKNETSRELTIQFNKFRQPGVTKELQESSILKYEWGIADQYDRFITAVTEIENLVHIKSESDGPDKMSFVMNFESEWIDTGCHKLVIRCYNRGNLFSNRDMKLRDCSKDQHNTVIDAKPLLHLPNDNPTWTQPDIDYLNSKSDLSAVWPGLRHGEFYWAVLQLPTNVRKLETAPVYPANHPYAIKDGFTTKNFVNVRELDLINGRKYLLCIQANVTLKFNERFKENITEVSACSDGVRIDRTPPIRGTLRMPQLVNQYQTSTSDMYLQWDGFSDMDESEVKNLDHIGGIHFHEYRVGTVMGKGNIRDYTSVGLSTSAVITDLILNPGLTYFVTIRATDYVGLMSESNSVMFIVQINGSAITNEPITINEGFINNKEKAKICWNDVFYSIICPITETYYALGSRVGRKDVIPLTQSNTKCVQLYSEELSRLEEGKHYFVLVKAINEAGFETTAISPGTLVDFTPPIKGQVFDIDPHKSSLADVGYRTIPDSLDAYWTGFYDPHSTILSYSYRIGLCQYCDNIVSKTELGIVDRVSITALQILTGKRYFFTIEACNSVGLCSEVSSNGVVFDDTPPTVGKVKDGTRKEEMDHSHLRNYISAMWYGFFDSQSKIQRYDWWVGTEPGANDILAEQNLHVTDVVYVNLESDLPINVKIYVTVRAFNYAGLYSEASSDGFIVDDVPPEIETPLYHDTSIGSIFPNSSVLNDYLRVKWIYQDPDRIKEHFVSIEAHSNGRSVIEPIKIESYFTEWTFTELNLKDGAEYRVILVSCSLANLCSRQNISVLIDSSQPTTGAVAIETEHAIKLNRSRSEWMIWKDKSIHIAWLGFIDPHSGIKEYGIYIGRSILTRELLEKEEAAFIDHDPNAENFAHEGPIQNAKLQLTETLNNWDTIFITLWAVNKVGLNSHPLTFSLKAAEGGNLVLSRRCEAQTCFGHCACSPLHQTCTPRLNNCEKLESRYNPNWWLEVSDEVDLSSDEPVDQSLIPTRTLLAAKWKITRKLGEPILKYECAAGYYQKNESQNDTPRGIFPLRDSRIWFDTVDDNRCILHIPNPEWLHPDIEYQMFVRVWYSDNQYFIFNSTGFRIHTKFPAIEKRLGIMVKEVATNTSKQDIDFIANNHTLNISWDRLFHLKQNVFSHYRILIGSFPGGGDVKTQIIQFINTTRFTFDNLDLNEHQKYFSTVVACDIIDLCRQQTSDGFVVDLSPPAEGRVIPGIGLTESEFQGAQNVLSAHWFGFVDRESYIKSYYWCVGSSKSGDLCDILPCREMNIRTFVKNISLPENVTSGTRIYHKVWAENQAGWITKRISSEVVIIDFSPPQWSSDLNLGPEELLNPSFELIVEDKEDVPDWTIDEDSNAQLMSNGSQAFEGSMFLVLSGSVRQTLFTTVGVKYRVVLHTTHMIQSQNTFSTMNVKVTIANQKWLFPMDANDMKISWDHHIVEQKWHKHLIYFVAKSTETELVISTMSPILKLGLDALSVKELKPSNEILEHSSPIHVEVVTGRSVDSVTANWAVEDPESGIEKYLWAIGTIPGGTQLLQFQSTGQQSTVTIRNVQLQHNVTIFVTVVAVNGVGLRTSRTSTGHLIDRTPPDILFVRHGGSRNKENVRHSSPHEDLIFQYDAMDPESGLHHCNWCAGGVPSGCNLHSFSRLEKNNFLHSYRLQNQSQLVGQTIFITIQCSNYAGLKSQRTSSELILADSSPKSEKASLEIINPSPSCYPRKSNILPIENFDAREANYSVDLMLKWEGFQDDIEILYYEMNVFNSNNQSVNPCSCWQPVGVTGESSLRYNLNLPNIRLYSDKFHCHVRAVNWMNMRSPAVVITFSVDDRVPIITDVRSTYLSSTVELTWSSYPNDVYYELSVGTSHGNADILRDITLRESSFQLSQLSENQIYFVVISVISESGLYSTTSLKLAFDQSDKNFHLTRIN